MSWPTDELELGRKHLIASDPVMRVWIDRIGPFDLKPRRDEFAMLVRSIISQQISTGAARSIHQRLRKRCAPGTITAAKLLRLTRTDFQGAGVSPQKQRYLVDLAEKVSTGKLRLKKLRHLTDDQIIEQLVQVKGIGVWTAQMFLIFSLGRPDVLPHADLGIRAAMKLLYGLKELPDKAQAHRIAEPWRPYATVASWYCWRCLEFQRNLAAAR